MSVFSRIMFLFALLIAPYAMAGEITVTGQGKVKQAPDMGTISVGSTFAAKTAEAALDEVSEATASLLAVLEEQGIASKDIQTSGLFLNPVWDDGFTPHGTRRIRGYSAGNTIRIQVRDLSLLGGLLDQAISEGANVFNGLSFGLQDNGPALDEARRRAVADARHKAEVLAEAAGLTLGEILTLSDAQSASFQPVHMERAAFAMSDAVPIAPGEVETSAQVSISFAISE